MPGLIRILVGFVVIFGAVGALENSTNSDLFLSSTLAAVGLLIFYSGVRATKTA